MGVSVDAQDRVYITGNTRSTDLPIVGAESDRTQHGGWDGYLAVFSADGSQLLCRPIWAARTTMSGCYQCAVAGV